MQVLIDYWYGSLGLLTENKILISALLALLLGVHKYASVLNKEVDKHIQKTTGFRHNQPQRVFYRGTSKLNKARGLVWKSKFNKYQLFRVPVNLPRKWYVKAHFSWHSLYLAPAILTLTYLIGTWMIDNHDLQKAHKLYEKELYELALPIYSKISNNCDRQHNVFFEDKEYIELYQGLVISSIRSSSHPDFFYRREELFANAKSINSKIKSKYHRDIQADANSLLISSASGNVLYTSREHTTYLSHLTNSISNVRSGNVLDNTPIITTDSMAILANAYTNPGYVSTWSESYTKKVLNDHSKGFGINTKRLNIIESIFKQNPGVGTLMFRESVWQQSHDQFVAVKLRNVDVKDDTSANPANHHKMNANYVVMEPFNSYNRGVNLLFLLDKLNKETLFIDSSISSLSISGKLYWLDSIGYDVFGELSAANEYLNSSLEVCVFGIEHPNDCESRLQPFTSEYIRLRSLANATGLLFIMNLLNDYQEELFLKVKGDTRVYMNEDLASYLNESIGQKISVIERNIIIDLYSPPRNPSDWRREVCKFQQDTLDIGLVSIRPNSIVFQPLNGADIEGYSINTIISEYQELANNHINSHQHNSPTILLQLAQFLSDKYSDTKNYSRAADYALDSLEYIDHFNISDEEFLHNTTLSIPPVYATELIDYLVVPGFTEKNREDYGE